jgi:hypothetical protein
MKNSPRVKLALPDKEQLVRELVLLAQEQLRLEGGKLAEQPFDKNTFFLKAGFVGFIWGDFLGDILARWLVDEDDLPESQKNYNVLRLAEHLLLCAKQKDNTPKVTFSPDNTQPQGRVYGPCPLKKRLPKRDC